MTQKRDKPLKTKQKRREEPSGDVLYEMLNCIRNCTQTLKTPRSGWVRAIQEVLGVTNVQLAERLGKVPQTIEDMQKSEAAGTIKLQSLRALAQGLGCELVYAIVPPKSLREMREERARVVAQQVLQRIHEIGGAKQEKGAATRQRQLEKLIEKVLAGNPKMLWK
jgi:predicted DNA-binding mobile mystery protein A